MENQVNCGWVAVISGGLGLQGLEARFQFLA